jgi:exosome complex component RRP45
MPREIAPSNVERDFLLSALKEGFRQDGRAFEEVRPLVLSFSSEFGFVDCRLGRTRSALAG